MQSKSTPFTAAAGAGTDAPSVESLPLVTAKESRIHPPFTKSTLKQMAIIAAQHGNIHLLEILLGLKPLTKYEFERTLQRLYFEAANNKLNKLYEKIDSESINNDQLIKQFEDFTSEFSNHFINEYKKYLDKNIESPADRESKFIAYQTQVSLLVSQYKRELDAVISPSTDLENNIDSIRVVVDDKLTAKSRPVGKAEEHPETAILVYLGLIYNFEKNPEQNQYILPFAYTTTEIKHDEIMSLFSAKIPVSTEIDTKGNNLLRYAIKAKEPQAAEFLLRNGADAHKKNHSEESAWDAALENENLFFINLLDPAAKYSVTGKVRELFSLIARIESMLAEVTTTLENYKPKMAAKEGKDLSATQTTIAAQRKEYYKELIKYKNSIRTVLTLVKWDTTANNATRLCAILDGIRKDVATMEAKRKTPESEMLGTKYFSKPSELLDPIIKLSKNIPSQITTIKKTFAEVADKRSDALIRAYQEDELAVTGTDKSKAVITALQEAKEELTNINRQLVEKYARLRGAYVETQEEKNRLNKEVLRLSTLTAKLNEELTIERAKRATTSLSGDEAAELAALRAYKEAIETAKAEARAKKAGTATLKRAESAPAGGVVPIPGEP